jgi:site-specific recombinase XerD
MYFIYAIRQTKYKTLIYTTKITRHSFATQQKRSGASAEEIKEAVGHQSVLTTEFYMDSFELSVKKTFAQNTSKFKE